MIIILVGCQKPINQKVIEEVVVNQKIMILLGDEFGNAYFDMKTYLQDRDFEVITVSVTKDDLLSCGNHDSIELTPDLYIGEIEDINEYSAIFIPPGKHHRTIHYKDDVKNLLNDAKEKNIIISSVCAGNIVLCEIDGLVDGIKISASAYTLDYIREAGGVAEYRSVVVDLPFITGTSGGGKSGNGYKDAPLEELANALKESLKE